MNSKTEVILVLSLLIGIIALGVGGYSLGKNSDFRISQEVIDAAHRGEYTERGSCDELAAFNNQPIVLSTSDEMP